MIVEEFSSVVVKILEYFFCGKFEYQSNKTASSEDVYDLDLSFLENMSGIKCRFGHSWFALFSIRQFVRIFSGLEQVMTTFQEKEKRPVIVITGKETAYVIHWHAGKTCLEPHAWSVGEGQPFTITFKVRCLEKEAEEVSLNVMCFLQRAALLHPDAVISLNHSRVNCSSVDQLECTMDGRSKLIDKLRFSLRSAGVKAEHTVVNESSIRNLQLRLVGSRQHLLTTDLTIITCKTTCPSSVGGHLHLCLLGTSGCPLGMAGLDWSTLVSLSSPHLCPSQTRCSAPSLLPAPDACYWVDILCASFAVLLCFTVFPHNESYLVCHQQLALQLFSLMATNRRTISHAIHTKVHTILADAVSKVVADDRQCCRSVAAAVSSVLRFSTNSEFRDHCFSLIGVNNVHGVGEELEKCLLECISPVVVLSHQNTMTGDSQATEVMSGSQNSSQGMWASQRSSSDSSAREEEDGANEFENMWIQRTL